MKNILCIIVFFILQNSFGQLKPIFQIEHKLDKDKNDVFDKLRVKLVYENRHWILKSLDDSVLYSPDKYCYYEGYNSKFILVSFPDSAAYARSYSEGVQLLPRDNGFIFYFDSTYNGFKKYAVKYGDRIFYPPRYLSYDSLRRVPTGSHIPSRELHRYVKSVNSSSDFRHTVINIDLIKMEMHIRNRKEGDVYLKLENR